MKKAVQFYFLLILPVVLFHSALEKILDKAVVTYLFKDFQSSYLEDGCLILVALLTLYYYFNRPKRYVPAGYRSVIILFISLCYLVYRFIDHHWIFFGFKSLMPIKYADIILLAATGELFLLVRSLTFKKIQQAGQSDFYGNQPITSELEDKLGYLDYANVIAEKLNKSHFVEAFAIGINGKWGSGKTSFLNLIKRKLNKEGRIILDFKPWNAHDPQAILKDFFETVQGGLTPYHATLANEIRDYGKKLVELHNNSVSQSLSAAFNLVMGYNESLSKQYEQINDGLKNIDQQLIICIDDLDRLDKKEINEVIRLIRNTANFYNTVFLAAYDREYLLSAIKQLNEYNHQHFLEKIFQLEINLPGFNMNVLKEYLNVEIIKVFGQGHEAECKAAVEELYTYKVNVLGDWIVSIRDIHHILNSLVVNAVQIKEEVLISDMLKLELLRYQFPLVYSDLFYRSERWLDAESSSPYSGDPSYTLRSNNHQLALASDLIDPNGPYQLSNDDAEKIIKLLNLLFKQSYYRTGQEYLALKYPLNFSKYFHYSLKKSQLSNKEFYEARGSDLDIFKEKIKEWIDKNYSVQLHRLFERIDDIYDQQDYEKIIRAIVFMSNTKLPDEPYSPFVYYAFKLQNFAYRIADYEFSNSKKLYNKPDGQSEEFKQFVKSIFDEATFPYHYEAQVLNHLKTADPVLNTPLTKVEIKSYLLKYFKDYLNKSDGFTFENCHFFDYFKTGAQLEYEGGGLCAPGFDETALNLFKQHIAKNLDDFLVLMITPEMRQKDCYSLSDFVFQVFLTLENFKQFISDNQNQSNYLTEFLDFLTIYEKVKPNNVSFDFQTIPIRKAE